MRNEISCLEHLKIGMMRNAKVREGLIKKYHLKIKTIADILEMLKQRISLTKKEIERYEARCQQFRQNRQFNSIKGDSIKISRKAIIIQMRKKSRSSGKTSGKILNNTIPKQTGLDRLNQY